VKGAAVVGTERAGRLAGVLLDILQVHQGLLVLSFLLSCIRIIVDDFFDGASEVNFVAIE